MADEKNIPLYVDPTILARDLSNSLSVASRSTTSPDDESQLRAASRRLGIPLETARTDPAATKQAVAQESFDATDYAKRFPTSAAYLANPDNALVARDDVEPLSAVEQAIRGQIQQNMLGDMGADPVQAATDRLLPDYAAERREREQVLRTEGFAAASALSRRQQQRRELLRATGSIGEIRQPEATPGNILSGLGTDATTGFKSARLGLAQQIGDLFGDDAERTEQYNRQREQLDFERQLATPEFDTNVARWTYGGFSSLAQTAPAVGLSVATGSPALGLSMMGLQTYGEAYGRYRGRDASRGMASLGAAGEASVEVLTEILPMRFAVDRLGKAGLTQFFAGFLGRDMAGEQIATLAQDAIDTAIANPTKTWNDYLAERPEAAIQTAFATLVQSGTLAAIGEGVGRLAGTIDREQYAADTANQNAQQLADLMVAAAASMTRQRDPQTFAQLVQGAAEDSGSSPTEIFIDARVLAPLLESAGMTPEQLAQSLPSVQEQLEEALATDGAIAIPIGEATAAFAGSGLEQELVRNARVSEDAWTAAEAEEGAQLLAQLEQDAQKVLAEQTEAQAWEESSNAVFDTLMGELSSAGRFTPDVNRAYATLVRNFYAVQASKLGIPPREMYAQFPLTVTSRAPGQQQAQVLDQSPQTDLQRALAMTEDEYIAAVNPANKRSTEDDIVIVHTGDLEIPAGATRVAQFNDKSGAAVEVFADSNGSLYAQQDGEVIGQIENRDGETLNIVTQEAQGKGVGTGLAAELIRRDPFAPAGSFSPVGEAARRAAFRKLKAEQGELNKSVRQTDTEAFKRWFGDSKVVDKSGEPLVVYHGTGSDITQFNTDGRGKTSGAGSFFSSSPAIAATYATGESPNVAPAYLSLKTPVVVDAGGVNWARLGRKVKVSMPAVEVSDQSDEDLLAELEGREPRKGVTKKLKAKNTTLGKLFADELVYDDDYASTDDLARWARSQGYDGIIIRKVMDHGPSGRFATDNKVSDIYVAFRPEQIKSAIGNRGTFDPADPNILNQSEIGERNLIAIHNLSAENLAFADKMGGIAVPSIGVVTTEAGGVDGFGEITLIGTKDMGDPRREPVFSADAYTVRFPKPEFRKAKSKEADALMAPLRPIAAEFGDVRVTSNSHDYMVNDGDGSRAIDEWLSSPAVMAMFLREKGRDVQPAMRDTTLESPFTAKQILEMEDLINRAHRAAEKSDFDDASVQEVERLLGEVIDSKYQNRPVLADRKKDNLMGQPGWAAYTLKGDLQKAKRGPDVDPWETKSKTRKMIEEAGLELEFKRWVESKVLPVMGEPLLTVGRKKVPYTLDNIVEVMTRGPVRGQEKVMVFGAGMARAASSVEFSDVEQMRKAAAESIVDPQQYEQAKATTEKLLDQYRDTVVQFTTHTNWQGRPDTFEALDASMRAIAKFSTKKKRDRAAMKAALKSEKFDVARMESATRAGAEVDQSMIQSIEAEIQKWASRLQKLEPGDSRLPEVERRLKQNQDALQEELAKAADQAPRDPIGLAMMAAEALLNAPVPYFEAKPQRAVSLNEFAGAVVPKNLPAEARAILEKAGLEITEYAPEGDRIAAVREVAARLDEQTGGGVLFQNQSQNARATFNPSTLNIALLEKADLSSFLHETGHFFFEMQATLAAQPNAPAEIVADMQTLLDHVGYTGAAAEWLAQPLNARREAHETIAETFEQYLFEGKAPSAELQGVFRRFRSWLISVYRSLQQMLATNERASLNPEVAAVFDRMIATDEAIAAAQAVRQFEPLFRSAEDAGMEPEAWAEYQATLQEQQAEAIEELQARTLRDLKWLDNARGRKLKELQKAAQAQRKAVRDEVTAEVNAQPIYKAMEFLKYGRIEYGNDQIQIEVTKAAKLNITELERMYPEGELGTGADWRKLGYGKYGMLSDAGLHPDTVAEMFGFRSGRQLVAELLNSEPKASVIDGMTDQRMLERHGDISSPEAMAEAANEALANDARSRLVATELKAVTKATGSPAALTRAARQAAEQIVAAKPVRNLRPDLAAASAARARKAAEKAMASGDTAAAAQAKRTEILQVQLERAQRRTQQEHDKALAGFKKIFKGTNEKLAKSRDVAMVTAARAVLARYGLAPNTSAANAQAYQQLLENYDGAMAADIKSILQGLPPSVDFRDLTVEQFRGMRDVVNGLYYLSRRTRQMEIDGQKVDIDAVADEIVTVVTERSGGTIPPLPGYTGTPTGLDKWKASLLSAKASLTRVEAWADNWGPAFKRYIWQPVSEATTVMRDKRNALVAQYRDLLKSIEKGITYNKIDAPELGPAGFVFNAGKSELLHAVLHSGNQSNLTKLLLGRGWGTLDANGQLDTSKWDQFITRMINEGVLTKADFDFAQGVWDLLETVKKDAQAAHKEMYGYYFNEVTADPINTPFGTYRGGYVPALADSLSSPDMAQKREQEELLHAGNSFMFPTTGKGFTQSRVFYNKPLELDLRAIGQHLDKVSRFAYLEPAIKDVAQLMGNKRVARALNGASPGAISDMLTPWLQRTARQSASMPGKNPKMNRFFNGLRSRTGLLFMFGNIVNTLQQLTGFSLAALKVPAPKLLRATAGYLAHPLKMRQQVGERSPWLAERMANQSYAMQDQIDQILTNPNPYEQFTDFVRRHAYFLQQAMQNVMDPIIWTGAYDHATAQGATEKEARRYADETVRTTQGSFAPEDIAAFEVQSPFVRLFTQFYGYFNMWGNLIGNEANKAVREAGFVRASPRLMFIWFAGLAIPAFVAELISQGTPDDEDDEDGDGLLDEWLAMFFGSQAKSLATMIPIAGHGAVLVANQSDSRVWNDRLNVGPALSAGESAGKGLAAILTGEVFDEEFTKTEFRSLLTLLGLGTGLPVAPVARAGGYLFDVESGRKDPQSAAEMGIGIATGR